MSLSPRFPVPTRAQARWLAGAEEKGGVSTTSGLAWNTRSALLREGWMREVNPNPPYWSETCSLTEDGRGALVRYISTHGHPFTKAEREWRDALRARGML